MLEHGYQIVSTVFFTLYLGYFINSLQICGVNNIRSAFLQSNMKSYQLYNNLKTETTNINVSHAMLVLITQCNSNFMPVMKKLNPDLSTVVNIGVVSGKFLSTCREISESTVVTCIH